MENHSPRERVVPMCTMQKMMNMSLKMIGMKPTWIPTTKMMMINTMNVMKNGMKHILVHKLTGLPLPLSGIRAKLPSKTSRSSMWRSSIPSTLHMPMPRADLHSCAKAVASTRLWHWWTARVPACLKVGVVQSLKAKVRRDPNNHHIHQRERVSKLEEKP